MKWLFQLLFVIGFIFCASTCKQSHDKIIAESDSLYSRALQFHENFETQLAIESIRRSLNLDSSINRLICPKKFVVLSLFYNQAGNYRDEMLLLQKLISLSPNPISNDTLTKLKSRLEVLCINFQAYRECHSLLRSHSSLSSEKEFQLAKLYLLQKNNERAEFHLLNLVNSDNRLIAVHACALLAARYDGYKTNATDQDSSTYYLNKMNALLKLILSDTSFRATEAFTIAHFVASSLIEYDDWQDEAIECFEVAQQLIQSNSFDERDPDMLRAWIQVQKTSLLLQDEDQLNASLVLYQKRGFKLGEAYTYLLLGLQPNLNEQRCIDFLSHALAQFESLINKNYSYRIQNDIDRGYSKLISFLIKNSRFFEAVEIRERYRFLKLYRSLDDQAPATASSEVIELFTIQREIAMISSNLDCLSFTKDEITRGVQMQLLKQRLVQVQGEYVEKLEAVRKIQPKETIKYTATAPTLSQIQSALSEDVIVLDFYFSNSISGFFIIKNHSSKFVSIPLPYPHLMDLLKDINFQLFNGLDLDSNDVLLNPSRQKLSSCIYSLIKNDLAGINKIYFISDLNIPLHILGSRHLLGERYAVSRLALATQLTEPLLSETGNIDSSNVLRVLPLSYLDTLSFEGILSNPKFFLLWHPAEITFFKSLIVNDQTDIAEKLRRFSFEASQANRYLWINIIYFGK